MVTNCSDLKEKEKSLILDKKLWQSSNLFIVGGILSLLVILYHSVSLQASQNEVSTSSLPKLPFSIKSGAQLDPSSSQFFEYKKDTFRVVSHTGILLFHKGEIEFTSPERWEHEFDYQCKLSRIPFFALFKKWKPFNMWRTKVHAKTIHLAKDFLQQNLFSDR